MMTNCGFMCIQHQLTFAASWKRIGLPGGWAITFNTSRLKLPLCYLSTFTFLSTFRWLFVGAVCSVSRVFFMAHYLQTNITRHIPNFPLAFFALPPSYLLSHLSLAERRGKVHIKCNIDIHIEIFPISS